jgi:hypothetical protein
MGGNDTIRGGDGDDFLYGGADPTQAGSGKDKLYGAAGGDLLFGGDDNDFLDSGLNVIDPYSPTEREDRLDGGDGNDVLIMRGMWCVAAGGAGDDQFWVTDTGDGWSYEITDSDAGDSLYWHGYPLTGGAKQVIEMIFDPDPAQGQSGYADVGALDGNGFRYYYGAVNADLFIIAPDGSGITIRNFVDGDLGIHVDGPASWSDVLFDSVEVQPDVWQYRYQTSLALSDRARRAGFRLFQPAGLRGDAGRRRAQHHADQLAAVAFVFLGSKLNLPAFLRGFRGFA